MDSLVVESTLGTARGEGGWLTRGVLLVLAVTEVLVDEDSKFLMNSIAEQNTVK
jgi:hypothetical protein